MYRVYHIIKPNDVRMLQLLHERNLPNGRRRRPFFRIEVNLFERDNFIRDSAFALDQGDQHGPLGGSRGLRIL